MGGHLLELNAYQKNNNKCHQASKLFTIIAKFLPQLITKIFLYLWFKLVSCFNWALNKTGCLSEIFPPRVRAYPEWVVNWALGASSVIDYILIFHCIPQNHLIASNFEIISFIKNHLWLQLKTATVNNKKGILQVRWRN